MKHHDDPIIGAKNCDRKVRRLYEKLVGDRVERLLGDRWAAESFKVVSKAFAGKLKKSQAETLAFHVCDWNSDAAFMVALHLFPERFTPADIRSGVIQMLIHTPSHMSAAAKIADLPITDSWGQGTSNGEKWRKSLAHTSKQKKMGKKRRQLKS